MDDLDPVSAVSAPDPYPYYSLLVAQRPLYFEPRLQIWVASSAQAVEEVLSNDALRVRPCAQPVPETISGTPMAGTFAQFARMTDGPRHAAAKGAVVAALRSPDFDGLAATIESCSDFLVERLSAGGDLLASYIFGLPALVIARLLGFSQSAAFQTIGWTGDFVRSIGADADALDLVRGRSATDALNANLSSLINSESARTPLLSAFLQRGRQAGMSDDAIVANALGFLFQGYDATAGLIGNTLVALARGHTADSLDAMVDEVARYDSPVQNTRRFAARDTAVLGTPVREGETILVVLAAANRDPSVNPNPHRFDAARINRHTYTFGAGGHACPAARIAGGIAGIGVARLMRGGIDLSGLASIDYRRSHNVRIPDFKRQRTAAGAPGACERGDRFFDESETGWR